MEDAATAEISRSQLWQWRVNAVPVDGAAPLTAARYRTIRDEELARLPPTADQARLRQAAELLDELVLADDYAEFLTLGAYPRLD